MYVITPTTEQEIHHETEVVKLAFSFREIVKVKKVGEGKKKRKKMVGVVSDVGRHAHQLSSICGYEYEGEQWLDLFLRASLT